MNIRKSSLTLLLILFALLETNAQIASIKQLGEDGKSSLNLYFYPSTIRMLNLDKDPDFYKMVENVKNLRVMTVDSSKLSRKEFKTIKKGILEENFEELATMRSGNSDVTLLAQYNGEEMLGMVALVAQPDSYMFLVLNGSIDVQKAMSMVKDGPNLKILDDFIGNEEDHQKKQKQARERYERIKAEQDSLDAKQ